MSETNTSSSSGCGCVNVLPATFTTLVGYHLHGSIFYAIMDFLFWPLVWLKWMLFHEVTLSAIKQTFSWFFQ